MSGVIRLRCDEIEEFLYLYEDGELDQKEKTKVEEHIRTCPNCSKKLADLKLIRAEVKEKKVPQPPETYWESFAQRVREKIERKTKVSFGQRFSHFLKTVFSYSPAEIKWATAIASVILLFVVVKLFVSYEKMDVTTIQQRIKVERTTTPREETPNVEIKTPEKKSGIVLEKGVPKTIRAPLKGVTISKGLESAAPIGKRGVQKETAIADRIAPDKDDTALKKLSTTTPELKEK
jgi:anti-sigma factor RsiW